MLAALLAKKFCLCVNFDINKIDFDIYYNFFDIWKFWNSDI